jgi:AmmeMemoRadiSam system protein A
MSENVSSLNMVERTALLKLARLSLIAAANHQPPPSPSSEMLTPRLIEPRACFVTLNIHENLRGCTGVLVARASLLEEVISTTAQTALHDPRFHPVIPAEVDQIEIEISVLTTPMRLPDFSPGDLPKLIKPFIDGVILYRGFNRATFLPQVWQKIPDPAQFLDALCQKAGLLQDSWRMPGIEVDIYQVEEFSEHDPALQVSKTDYPGGE